MNAPRFQVVAVELYERPVKLRMPFRFGVVTLTAAPQAFVRARIRLEDGREGWGGGAELLAPKWFDKNLALLERGQLRPAAARARARAGRLSRRRYAHRVRALRRALPRGDRRGRAARSQPAGRVLRPGAARPRDPRRAVPAPADVVPGGDPGQLRRDRPGRAGAGPGGLRHRRLPRAASPGGIDCGTAHGGARRRHRRSSAAGERRPPRVARRGGRDLRPHLVQAEGRREGR